MSKTKMGLIAAAIVAFLTGLVVLVCVVSAFNGEARLRNAITAKQKDNASEYDNMWKKISQVAQVTDAQKRALLEIFVQHAKARAGEGRDDGAIFKWIKESVPNVDTSTFNNLQNIITSSRDRFTMRQKELLDFKREHDNLIDIFPSGTILAMFGRQKIEVTIVTSTRTDNAFSTGKDDDAKVFGR